MIYLLSLTEKNGSIDALEFCILFFGRDPYLSETKFNWEKNV